MPFRLIKSGVNFLARWAGYVPISEMEAALQAKDATEQELRHKTRGLEQQIYYRDRLEKELDWLKELELAHARKESGTQRAVEELDRITNNLLDMMRDVWPDALQLEDTAVEEAHAA